MAELIIVPNSACIGKTTAELQFRTKSGLNVVGIKRDGVVLSLSLIHIYYNHY